MAIDFNEKDVTHRVIAKFVPAYLPTANKKFYARPVLQEVLGIHEIASKAVVYNITTPAAIIEEGLLAAEKLIAYLVADNYKINTELFQINIRIPGEFNGTETHLTQGTYPELNITADGSFRRYIRERVHVQFDGVEDSQGYIGQIVDGATGRVNEVVTRGNILIISGYGLKVESDDDHASQVGVFLVTDSDFERAADVEAAAVETPAVETTDGEAPAEGVSPADIEEVPVKALVVNEPRTLKVLVPTNLVTNKVYTVVVRTQGAAKSSGHLIKDVRTVTTDITLSVL